MRNSLALLLFLPLLSAQARQETEEKRVIVTLEDGSRLAAKLTSEPIELVTDFGTLKIPMQDIRSIKRADGEEHIIRTTRLTVQGKLARNAFAIDTEFGKLSIPARDVKSIDHSRGSFLFLDDATIAFWSFEDTKGAEMADLAADRTVKLVDGEVQDESSGIRAFVRRDENSYVQGNVPEDFNFGEGAFTIEVRVKVGSMTRGYATLVARNEEGNCHNRDFWFLVQQGGQLYFDSGNASRTHFVSQTPSVIKMNEWTYIAMVYDPKATEIRYFVNGRKVHTDRRSVSFNASTGPLFLGPGAAGRAYFSCPERFQFMRVTKAARTDEEIAEWNKALESEASFTTRVPGRGVSLKDGGFLKADVPGIVGAKFRSRFGTLEITAETRGRIEIYPYREKDIEAIQPEVERLIEKLGARSVEEREEAQKELIKIGGPAVKLVTEAKGSSDPEVVTRAEAILKRWEQSGVLRRPASDVLRMGRTILHGWLEVTEFEAASKYGTFKADIRVVSLIALSEPEKDAAGPIIRLRSGEVVEGDPRESTVSLETDFGTLKVPLKDVVQFRYDDGKKHWIIKTDKAVLTGKVSGDRISLQTQAGSISVPLSEMAEFGK
jgi:hypothetical protein